MTSTIAPKLPWLMRKAGHAAACICLRGVLLPTCAACPFSMPVCCAMCLDLFGGKILPCHPSHVVWRFVPNTIAPSIAPALRWLG